MIHVKWTTSILLIHVIFAADACGKCNAIAIPCDNIEILTYTILVFLMSEWFYLVNDNW